MHTLQKQAMVTLEALKISFACFVIIVSYHVLTNTFYVKNVIKYNGHLICSHNGSSRRHIHTPLSNKKCIEEVKSKHGHQTVDYKHTFDKNLTYADDISQWQYFIHQEGKYKVLLRSLVFADNRKSLRDTPCIRLLIISTKEVPQDIWKHLV